MRVLIVKNIVSPNTTPLFRELARRDDCELRVVYETATEANRRWDAGGTAGYDAEVLSSRTVRMPWLASETYVHVPRGPMRALTEFDPDVVVASGGVWSSPTNVLAMLRGRRRWAFVPWWGEFQSPGRGKAARVVEPWKRRFVSAGDGWLAYSDRAADDAARLGADPARTVVVPNTPRDPVLPSSPAGRPHDPAGIRLLFVGQLIERKGLDTLLEAFTRVEGAELRIAGTGPMEDVVRKHAAEDPRIRYLGHLDWEGLQQAYADADVLVLPSRYEVWGLVVNEAAAHGMACIVSDQVGAGDHLVAPGQTGYVFEAGNPTSLATTLRRQLDWTREAYDRCGAMARTRMQEWSVAAAAEAVVKGCALSLERAHADSP